MVEVKKGGGKDDKVGGLSVIDDAYNASHESVKAAIELLTSDPGHRFLVAGDMAELVSKSSEYHE